MSADPSLDELADEAAELDGYFSDAPLNPEPRYPELDTSMDNALIVQNLPKVPEAKLDKLTKVVTKLLTRIGNLAATETFPGMLMPFENDSTLGFCLVAYETPAEAEKALFALQDYAFDKNHSLTVIRYERALQLQEILPTSFKEPEPAPFVERPNPTSWLEDPNQRDAFVLRHGRETQVQWWDSRQGPAMDYDGSREKQAGVLWCENYCFWSPKGSHLATLLPARGVILWSGAKYEKSGRFAAPGVRHILFSPQENYLLTSNEDPRDPEAIKIYHVPTERLLRAFPLYPEGFSKDLPPPPFQWSHDDQYIARMGNGLIRIYETPGMRLLDQRSLAAEGVADFQWSPADNTLAYWVSYVLSLLEYDVSIEWCLTIIPIFCDQCRRLKWLTLQLTWMLLRFPHAKGFDKRIFSAFIAVVWYGMSRVTTWRSRSRAIPNQKRLSSTISSYSDYENQVSLWKCLRSRMR